MKRIATLSFAAFAVLALAAPLQAQAANPCNPCSMEKPANPCNPCSMKKPANPCSPEGDMKSGDSMTDANGRNMIRKPAFKNFRQAADSGAAMWKDESLGKAGVACMSCHSGFARLHFDKNQTFPHYVEMVGDVVSLDQMINFCMLNPMQGKPFEANSKELTAMAAFYRAYRMQYLREHR